MAQPRSNLPSSSPALAPVVSCIVRMKRRFVPCPHAGRVALGNPVLGSPPHPLPLSHPRFFIRCSPLLFDPVSSPPRHFSRRVTHAPVFGSKMGMGGEGRDGDGDGDSNPVAPTCICLREHANYTIARQDKKGKERQEKGMQSKGRTPVHPSSSSLSSPSSHILYLHPYILHPHYIVHSNKPHRKTTHNSPRTPLRKPSHPIPSTPHQQTANSKQQTAPKDPPTQKPTTTQYQPAAASGASHIHHG